MSPGTPPPPCTSLNLTLRPGLCAPGCPVSCGAGTAEATTAVTNLRPGPPRAARLGNVAVSWLCGVVVVTD